MNAGRPPVRVFLVGCPRSGTTLLQRLLSERGALRTVPETLFFERMLGDFAQRTGVAKARRTQRIHDLLGTVPARGWREVRRGLDAAAAALGLPAPRPRRGLLPRRKHAVRAFVALMDAGARTGDSNGWLEKTPNHLAYVDLIADQIPDARFVHLARTGRDVIASILRARLHYHQYPMASGFQGDVVHWARYWNWCLWQHWRFAGDPCHRVVFYEDMLADPEREIGALLNWLGVAPRAGAAEAAAVADVVVEPWKRGAVTESPMARAAEALAVLGSETEAWLARQLLPYEAIAELIRQRQLRDSNGTLVGAASAAIDAGVDPREAAAIAAHVATRRSKDVTE